MIPAAPRPTQPAAGAPDWKRLWRDAVRDPAELLALLDLAGRVPDLSADAAAQFPLRVPRGFVARMRPGDPHDPLLRQVLPLDAELRPMPGFSLDAVGDGAAKAGAGARAVTRIRNRTAAAFIEVDRKPATSGAEAS